MTRRFKQEGKNKPDNDIKIQNSKLNKINKFNKQKE